MEAGKGAVARGATGPKRNPRPSPLALPPMKTICGRRRGRVAWLVGTQVICYGSALEASLQRVCNSTARLPRVRTPWHPARERVNNTSAACAAVRAAYSQDWALYRRHCLHGD